MHLRSPLVSALAAGALLLPTAVSVSAPLATTTVAASAATSGSTGGAAATRSTLGKPSARSLQMTTQRERVKIRVNAPRGQKVHLQRLDAGRWRTVSTTTAPRSGSSALVQLALPAKAGYRSYRVVLAKSGSSPQRISTTVKIFQSDTKKHAAYIAKARAYMKAYCPSTPIYINSPRVTRGNTIGQAWTTWRWTSDGRTERWSWNATIELRSGLGAAELRHTALHECAHIVQARPIRAGQKAYDASVARTEKAFAAGRAEPQEQQADCMATARTGSTRFNYYTKSCSGSRLKNAKQLWSAYGKKYQDPRLTWTRKVA